jgi:hypothetical protein
VAGYNLDRPCAFIDADTFVIAVDDLSSDMNAEDLPSYVYHQLEFYRLSDKTESWNEYSKQTFTWIPAVKKVNCSVFPLNEYGEVTGELYYDSQKEYLVAISDKGAFALTLDGEVIHHVKELANAAVNVHSDFEPTLNWQYCAEHHMFYRYEAEVGIAERTF